MAHPHTLMKDQAPGLQASEGMLFGTEQVRAAVAAMVAVLPRPEGVR